MNTAKAKDLAIRWMPGTRHGENPRLAWEHPQDLVELLPQLPLYRDMNRDHLEQVAWMHDLLEDGKKGDGSRVTALDLLKEGFTRNVVEDVVTLSKDDTEEKAAYLERLYLGTTNALLVKCVDRICNLREGAVSFKLPRWTRYVAESEKYILPLTKQVHPAQGEWLEAELLAAISLRPERSTP